MQRTRRITSTRAIAMNLAMPGLGYWYCEFRKTAITVTFCVRSLQAAIMLASWYLGSFILVPIGLLVLSSLFLQLWMNTELHRLCKEIPAEVPENRYNTPRIYFGAFMCGTVAPAIATFWLFSTLLYGSLVVNDEGMYPGLVVGDKIYYERFTPEDSTPLKRGQLVVTTTPDSDKPRILRLVGLPGDTMTINTGSLELSVNGLPFQHTTTVKVSLQEDLPKLSSHKPPLLASTEIPPDGEAHWIVFHSEPNPQVGQESVKTKSVALEAKQVYLMADLRSSTDCVDSRCFGPIPLSSIIGRPRYIWWSGGNDSVNWSRIGIDVNTSPVFK